MVVADTLDCFQFQFKYCWIADIAKCSSVPEHRIGLFWFKFFTANQISIFVGSKVSRPIDNWPWMKSFTKGLQVLAQLINEHMLFLIMDKFFGMSANTGNHKLGTQKPHTVDR